MENTKLNILPVPTFASLGVNFAQREIEESETEDITVTDADKRELIQYIRSGKTTNITINDNAASKLVQIFDGKARAASRLNITLGDNAKLDLIQLYLGGGQASEIVTELKGDRAGFTANIAYDLGAGDDLDVNLIADHLGRKSTTDIAVSGVLRDDAKKTFKGTIDFKRGAAGAVGSEKEEVILLSEKAVNKTVPVILCDEEDVVGNHGATIGRIDGRHIFYMRSRGIPEEKIYELIARSKLMKAIRLIDDKATKIKIFETLGWGDEIEQLQG